MPRLLALLAARVGGLLNVSELSRLAGLPNSTLKRYMSLLEATFVYQPLPAWPANLGKRLISLQKFNWSTGPGLQSGWLRRQAAG